MQTFNTLFFIAFMALFSSVSSFLISAPSRSPSFVASRAATATFATRPEDMDAETWEKFKRLCNEEGEEEGKMELGVELGDTDMMGWIEGMDKMTPEEYKAALNQKVVKALEDQRARGTNGNRATDNYFENLNSKPRGDGNRSGRW